MNAHRAVLAKFVRYVAVGGSAAVVDIGLFHLLAPHSADVWAPAIVSFLVAATYNYLVLAKFVYAARPLSARRVGAFFLGASLGLVVNAVATYALHHVAGVSPTWAKTGGVALAFAANFAMNTFIVFRAHLPT